MRQPAYVFLAISLVLINACGRIEMTHRNAAAVDLDTPMAETDAMSTLAQVPAASAEADQPVAMADASAQGLTELLASIAASQQGRGAVSSAPVDLSQLTTLLGLVQSGQASSILGLTQGLISSNAGDASTTGSKLSGIMNLLNVAMPIIMTIAPQYAPIIQAVMTIIPLVITFIGMFKKPKPAAPSAFMPFWVPNLA